MRNAFNIANVAVITRIVIIAITIFVSYFFPYYVSLPRWTSGEWAFFYFLSHFFPVLVTIFFIVLAASHRKVKWVALAIPMLYTLYAVAFAYFAFFLYREWSADPAGQYFLPPKSDHYYNVLVRFGRPYLEAALTGTIFVFIFWLLTKLSKRQFVEPIDLWVLLFIGSVLSLERGIIAIFTAFLLMIGASLWYTVRKKPRRVKLFFPLMIGCWIAMFWGDIVAHVLFNT